MIVRIIAAAGFLLATPALARAAGPEAEPRPAPASPALSAPALSDLAGRWAGAGTVKYTNGSQRPYKCVITNFITDNGAGVKQTLRCRTADDDKFEVASSLKLSGSTITGNWEEQQHALSGTVKGKMTPTGYQALAHNSFFQATFEISLAGPCEQHVTIRPSRDISLITARLRKC
jgi:hypothetical protein